MKTKEDKGLQRELVARTYAIHEKLRRERRNNSDEDWELIWKQHVKDSSILQEYAAAMTELAVKIWDPKFEHVENTLRPQKLKCRLDWVDSKCREYFRVEGKMKESKLKFLDVGSCYNPFKKFRDSYDITAIDLCPAAGHENEIFQCDFLELNVTKEDNVQFGVCSETKRLFSLPENYFDVVVFSFFLGYLPDQKQRLKSCQKAFSLLKTGGMLFILRPDSNKITPEGNSRSMKALKVGVGLLGFKRVYFEKLKHLWCLGFVKLSLKESGEFLDSLRFQNDAKKVKETFNFSTNEFSNLFIIHQDSKTYEEKNVLEYKQHVLDTADVESFLELPEYFSDSE